MSDDWMTEAPQSGPMVVTSKLSVERPRPSATWFARAVASSALVVVVRTRKPSSPLASVVWMTASGSPAWSKAVRICSVVTPSVPWNATDVPPTNSMPKFKPRTPTTTNEAATSTAATPRNTRRCPRKLMSCLMNLPRTCRARCAASSPACPSFASATRSLSTESMARPTSASAVVVPSAAASAS